MRGRGLFLVLVAPLVLAGCTDDDFAFAADDLEGLASGCGGTRTEPRRFDGESGMALAAEDSGAGARSFTWTHYVGGVCTKAHAKATATLLLAPMMHGNPDCEGATVRPADGRVFVAAGFQGYPLRWDGGQHDAGLASSFEARNDDIGLKQAFKEDEPGSYLISTGVVYQGPGYTSPNIARACVASVFGSLTLEATYREFKAPEEPSP